MAAAAWNLLVALAGIWHDHPEFPADAAKETFEFDSDAPLQQVSRRWGRLRFVEGAVAEHREQVVGPAQGETEHCLGVVLALDELLVVYLPDRRPPRRLRRTRLGPRCRVAQGCESGEEEGSFELLVSSPGGLFAED